MKVAVVAVVAVVVAGTVAQAVVKQEGDGGAWPSKDEHREHVEHSMAGSGGAYSYA